MGVPAQNGQRSPENWPEQCKYVQRHSKEWTIMSNFLESSLHAIIVQDLKGAHVEEGHLSPCEITLKIAHIFCFDWADRFGKIMNKLKAIKENAQKPPSDTEVGIEK